LKDDLQALYNCAQANPVVQVEDFADFRMCEYRGDVRAMTDRIEQIEIPNSQGVSD
jgi:hypothetical protein